MLMMPQSHVAQMLHGTAMPADGQCTGSKCMGTGAAGDIIPLYY